MKVVDSFGERKFGINSWSELPENFEKRQFEEIDFKLIDDFLSNVTPLIPQINYSYKIYKKEEVNLKTKWSAPYYLAIFSEKKEDYGLNVGFVFQQLSLYLQKNNIGSCWVGLGSLKEKNPEFVILIAFGKSEDRSGGSPPSDRRDAKQRKNTARSAAGKA